MNLILILAVLVIILAVCFFLSMKKLNTKIKANNDLKKELETQQQNTLYLYKHAEEIAEIEKDKNEVNQEIEECKTDEETLNVINTIVAANNSRVQNSSKK